MPEQYSIEIRSESGRLVAEYRTHARPPFVYGRKVEFYGTTYRTVGQVYPSSHHVRIRVREV